MTDESASQVTGRGVLIYLIEIVFFFSPGTSSCERSSGTAGSVGKYRSYGFYRSYRSYRTKIKRRFCHLCGRSLVTRHFLPPTLFTLIVRYVPHMIIESGF